MRTYGKERTMESVVDIDEEFAALGTSLSPEELSLLEANIDEHGCLDSLKVWTEKGVLLDGHNRYRICKQLGKDFQVEHLSFKNREAAIEWVIDYQLGRRNASEEQKSYYRGKRYRHEKKKNPNQDGRNQHTEVKGHDVPQPTTAEKLGKEYGVSSKTIKRDAKFAAAVDKVAQKAGPDAKTKVLSGELKAERKHIVALADLPEQDVQKAIAGGKSAVKEAVKKAAAEKATEGLPASITPHQQAKEDAARRWSDSLHKLWQLLNSVRDCGGIAKLCGQWSPKARSGFAAGVRKIRTELDKWLEVLEDK